MVTKTTNPNKIMGVGPFRGFSATHKDLVMETISNVKSSHAFIFMCQLSVSPLFQPLQYVIAINVLQGWNFWKGLVEKGDFWLVSL